MTPLTQQLEDKKKENYERADSCLWQEIDKDVEEMLNAFFKKWCGNMSAHLSDNDENDGQRLKNFIMMYKNKAEIAILEQAIAEMQNIQNHIYRGNSSKEKDNQRVPISESATDELNNESKAHSQLSLQKQRQEILDKIDLYLMVTKGNYECQKALEELKQQLNQPKTEE